MPVYPAAAAHCLPSTTIAGLAYAITGAQYDD
jgi:hypothetical protein